MDFIKKYFALVIIGAACIAALVVYTVNIPNKRSANAAESLLLSIFAPVMRPSAAASGFVVNIWDNYLNLIDVRRENLMLREQIKQMNIRIIESQDALLANQRLEKLLEMKKKLKPNSLAVNAIGDDVTPWYHSLVIDRGASSAITEGMAVVAANGVVGQVVKVATNTSRVLLLTDHTSGIAATILRSRARGVVKGKGESGCTLEFASRDDDIKVGDMVVTSGIGGVFPKGIPIGEVTMVKRGEYGVFQTVAIRPSVQMSHIEEMLVLTGSPND